MKLDTKAFGRWFIVLGVLGFVITSVLSVWDVAAPNLGTIPASSILMIMIGMSFAWPSLLEESAGQISTMRVIVFCVVLVFVTIEMKIGWSAGRFEDFTIDRAWVYILGLAFGAKAAQRYGESDDTQGQAAAVAAPHGQPKTQAAVPASGGVLQEH